MSVTEPGKRHGLDLAPTESAANDVVSGSSSNNSVIIIIIFGGVIVSENDVAVFVFFEGAFTVGPIVVFVFGSEFLREGPVVGPVAPLQLPNSPEPPLDDLAPRQCCRVS